MAKQTWNQGSVFLSSQPLTGSVLNGACATWLLAASHHLEGRAVLKNSPKGALSTEAGGCSRSPGRAGLSGREAGRQTGLGVPLPLFLACVNELAACSACLSKGRAPRAPQLPK